MATSILSSILAPKRRVFLSYHHGGDRIYYNRFAHLFSEQYEAVLDSSLDRQIDSDDADYVIRKIREDYITGTTCTIVLCGARTPWRKFVDWEIKATLDKQHGLIGMHLPSNPLDENGRVIVPNRLHDNIQSGYALWLQWENLSGVAPYLSDKIELANSKKASLIDSSRTLREGVQNSVSAEGHRAMCASSRPSK